MWLQSVVFVYLNIWVFSMARGTRWDISLAVSMLPQFNTVPKASVHIKGFTTFFKGINRGPQISIAAIKGFYI